MKKFIVMLSAMLLCMQSGAQLRRNVCDETCREEYLRTEVPQSAAKTAVAVPKSAVSKTVATRAVPAYAVVCPVGMADVGMIRQAPRLETLDGKRIAVVGVSFMTGITHPEIKRLILENYPAPGVTRRQNEEFRSKLKEMKIDALISGNGGCGLCTPKETGSCITAEYLGIPSVMIAGPGFSNQTRVYACSDSDYQGSWRRKFPKDACQYTRLGSVLLDQWPDCPRTRDRLRSGPDK